jgi:hypothetical protein
VAKEVEEEEEGEVPAAGLEVRLRLEGVHGADVAEKGTAGGKAAMGMPHPWIFFGLTSY